MKLYTVQQYRVDYLPTGDRVPPASGCREGSVDRAIQTLYGAAAVTKLTTYKPGTLMTQTPIQCINIRISV